MEGSEWAEAEEVGVDSSDMEFGAVNEDAIFESQVGGWPKAVLHGCADMCGRESRIVLQPKKLPDSYICYGFQGPEP